MAVKKDVVREQSITTGYDADYDDEYFDDDDDDTNYSLRGPIDDLLSCDTLTIIRPHDTAKIVKIPNPNNYYEIYNDSNQKIAYMKEVTSLKERVFAQSRSFTIEAYDINDHLLMKFTRSRTFVKSNVKVYYNHPIQGMVYLGRSKYTGKVSHRHYELYTVSNDVKDNKDEEDESDHLFAKIEIQKHKSFYNPLDTNYSVVGFNQKLMGSISKKWNGWKQEALTTKNVYQLQVSHDSVPKTCSNWYYNKFGF